MSNRSSPDYIAGHRQFTNMEPREQQLNQQREAAFARFDQLQRQTLAAADSIRIQRELWAEQAFAEFDQVIALKLRESGREELADTTNAAGIAVFSAPEGQWWVYARYTLPYEELYWNVPVEVTGDSLYVPLNRENAEVRPVL
jgi:hypothetical protein